MEPLATPALRLGGALAAAAALVLAGCAAGPTGAAPPAGPAPPLFRDATTASGLDFVHFAGKSGELYFSEILGAGVALFDYDGDGDLDLFLAQGRPLAPDATPERAAPPPAPGMLPLGGRLYRNDLGRDDGGRPVPRFTDVTAASGIVADGYGMGVATGDVDNDGWTDLFLTTTGPDRLYRNRGDGTFAEVAAAGGADDPRWNSSAAFFDYDLDGWLDLYVVAYVDYAVERNPRCQALNGVPDYCRPEDFPPLADRLYRNRGDGTFEDVSGPAGILAAAPAAGLGVVTGDFDADGRPDLYVANDGWPNHLWLNRGPGAQPRFVERGMELGCALNREGTAEAGMGAAAGDYDGDGDEDLLVTNLALETDTLYRLDGGRGFADVTRGSGLAEPSWPATSFGAVWLDYDGDGRLDLATVAGGVGMMPRLGAMFDPQPLAMSNHLYYNRGDGTFADVSAAAGGGFTAREVSRGLAVGDLDNDGDPDLVVSNNDGPARLLLDDAGPGGHWLGLRLVGAGAGSDRPGAWARLLSGGPPLQVRRVRTDGSYLSASDPRLLFRLGASAAPAEVGVAWPGGRRERFRAAADGYTTLREGSGEEVGDGSPLTAPLPAGASPTAGTTRTSPPPRPTRR